MISFMHKTNEPNSRRRNEMSYIEIDDCKNDMLLSISNKCVDSVKGTTSTSSLSKVTATGTSKQRVDFFVKAEFRVPLHLPCEFIPWPFWFTPLYAVLDDERLWATHLRTRRLKHRRARTSRIQT
jgi:hypothetical protein